jgi:uncharacterized protein
MNLSTPLELTGADHEPVAEVYTRAGRVVSTTGSQIIVLLDKGLRARGGLQMGGLVRVQSEHVVVYGVVEGLCTPMPTQEGNGDEMNLAEIGLLGQMCDANSPSFGGLMTERFCRGVSHVPALDSVVCVASQSDIKNVYAIPGRREVIVGTLNNDPQVAARISVNDMLGKHFALLGTTGTGKSCALTLMIKRILEQSQNGHVLLLDPHGEYGRAFSDQAAHLTVDSFRLPYWIADFEELTEIVFGYEKRERATEIMLLKEMVLAAKLDFAQPADRARITADSPVPYNMDILHRHIDNAMGSLDNRRNIESFQRIKSRLAVMQNDKRYAFMFDRSLGIRDDFGKVMGEMFRVPANGKPLAILDLAGIPSEVLNVVVALVCRIAFDFAVCVGQTFPLLLICEEAHRYAPQDTALGFEPAKRALARIAKEGRKYGISLGIVSQRPSDLAAAILSQCNTVFAFRMANARDQEIIQATLPEASPAMFSALPFLGNMEAIAIGEGVPVPMRLQFELLPEAQRPRSGSALFAEQWQRQEDDDGAQMQRAVDSMRNRKSV